MQTETAIKRDYALTLKAKLAPWMVRLLEKPTIISQLVEQYGSPLHVLVEAEFKRNVQDLLSPVTSRGLSGNLYFARKANKLSWFVNTAKNCGIGVDIASLPELQETIAMGVDSKKIVVTAIGKSRQMLQVAISNDCLLVIDNADELDEVALVAQSLNKIARVGLRIAGFVTEHRTIYSRFGVPVNESAALIHKIIANSNLNLELLHAHLDRYDTNERAAAARKLLEFVDMAADAGHKIEGIDLGGGILIRYLESETEWSNFLEDLKSSIKGTTPRFTFGGDGFGYQKLGDEIVGTPDLYPMWNKLSKERFIGAVLDNNANGIPLHKEIGERGLKLYFEPGRALLDNTGMTFANVPFRKRDTTGNLLVGLGMNRFNLRPFRAEFCSDPILVNGDAREKTDESAFFVGNMCSESDLIFRRKLQLRQMPQTDDIYAFANTAGYLAHHLEVGTHGGLLPTNLLLDPANFSVLDAK